MIEGMVGDEMAEGPQVGEDVAVLRGELADGEERGGDALRVQEGAQFDGARTVAIPLSVAGAVVVGEADGTRREPVTDNVKLEEHQRWASSRRRQRSTSAGRTRRRLNTQGSPRNAAAKPRTEARSQVGCPASCSVR